MVLLVYEWGVTSSYVNYYLCSGFVGYMKFIWGDVFFGVLFLNIFIVNSKLI